MKKYLVLIILIVFIVSCSQKGIWKNGMYRTKKNDYSLNKVPFCFSDKVVFNKMYLSHVEKVSNHPDSNVLTNMVSGIGFYSDGRFVINGYNYENRFAENESKNIWKSAQEVGCYRIKNNRIQIEFLSSQDSGRYIRWEGEIKGDTLVFYKTIYHPIRKEIREEQYILSDMSFDE
ncbi:MAG: hypothetical protein LBE34_02415 [Flavobacteriaceae bacterium]|jgi:hypothetical protein|nr:hypothetical protein [Flavobacteriaceae bacterium]